MQIKPDKTMPDVNEIPVIGEPYQGAGIVTAIDEQAQETPGRGLLWNRRIITTDQGAIFTLDHYVEKLTGGNGVSAETNAPAIQQQNQQQHHQQQSPPTPSQNNNVPLTITVYSKNDPDLPSSRGSNASSQQFVGIWSFGDGNVDGSDESEDEPFWKPQQVLLYKPGLETIPEEETLPSGVWGYAEDQVGHDKSSGNLNKNKNNKNGNVDPDDWRPTGCALVVPPSLDAPANFVPAGRYTYKPGSLHTDWPPPVDNIKKQLFGVGKIKIPKCFEENDGKLPIKVFPKSKLPVVMEQIAKKEKADSKTKGVTFAPPVGQWAYPEGEEENDDHFLPVDVDLYWGDDRPASISGAPSDDGSIVSWGVWGSQAGSVDLDDPEWEPEMSMVFPPGIDPDPEIAIQGIWAYRMNQNVKIEWPPPATKTALVFPSKDAPSSAERGMSQGVWAFQGERNDANEDDWDPFEVEILGEDDSLGAGDEEVDDADGTTRSRPHGVWGIKHGAEPDLNWDWKPCDVVFFPPNVQPHDNAWVQGRWATKRAVGKLKDTWPPTGKSVNKSSSMGKMKPLNWPKLAWVFPSQSLPQPEKSEALLGVWRFNEGVEPKEASSWKPQQVDLYSPTDKVDDTKPSGSWGVDANAAETRDSQFEPSHVWFYPPGQAPEIHCSVQGRWAFQKSKLDVSWPPPMASPTGQAKGKSRSVGKLKIPGAFESEASPRVGRRRASSANGGNSDPKVPSLFSHF